MLSEGLRNKSNALQPQSMQQKGENVFATRHGGAALSGTPLLVSDKRETVNHLLTKWIPKYQFKRTKRTRFPREEALWVSCLVFEARRRNVERLSAVVFFFSGLI